MIASRLRRLAHQVDYRLRAERPASRLGKALLGLRYDCYVSSHADVFCPDRIKLAPRVRIERKALLNFNSRKGPHRINLEIGADTRVMPYANLIPQQGSIRIGRNCTVQFGAVLYGVGGLEIGDNTRIAARTIITPMNHVFDDAETPIYLQGESALGVKIGSDVWIGTNAKILDGVEIGDGCIVGAGSVVTKTLPPYAVAVGVPARVIRFRRSLNADQPPSAAAL
jgi:acetyltransferase-like isoleucine patch superfamily enzyme